MFGRKTKELLVPPAAKNDPRAIELIRVWAADGNQHVSISPDVWDDPATWGVMLVDLAKHVATFYAEERGMDKHAVLARIKTLFEAEWDSPTSEVTGNAV
ncbi:protein of unknown function [Dyella sp. OK004]|nr:protein of unknown function [Dyella sp. OK004]